MKHALKSLASLAALALALGAPHAASADTICITDVMLIGGTKADVNARKNTYTNQGWTVVDKDLNAGCGNSSDYIYLLVKSASVENATNGFITGFYIKTGSTDVTPTRTYKDRFYRLVPYDGGSHFKEQKGDLNSNTGDSSAAIHLYCTKSAFPDNRAVTAVSFDGNQSGAVGADGGSEGYDLNDGCGAGTQYIYMHVTTAAVPYVPPVAVTDVVARQRWPWNGLVDITCTVSGTEWTDGSQDFVVAAVMDSGNVHTATNFWTVRNGKKAAVRNVSTNGNYRLLWDAGADLGTGGVHSNVVLRVTVVKGHPRVQLWEGGPYWATTNVGAEKPEAYGYYFWWGDTIGYKWENNQWVATDGSVSGFSFEAGNTPTLNKRIDTLKSESWITADGVLAPEHDAAHVHWGGGWRMPTQQELDDLVNKCNWEWTTQNGVKGWTVTGKDSASIFLPCAGHGNGASLSGAGSYGYFWSSVPYSGYYSNGAWGLYFYVGNHGTGSFDRDFGQSVRPVQGFTE